MIERVTMMLLLLAAGTALAQSPGTHYPSGGTRPGMSAQATAGTNAPYARTITVYGNVNTNDLLRFMDRTGSRVSGTNVLGALDYYGTNWQARVNALTNGAALGATALQPSWAETGTVIRATEVIGAQSTLIETAWQNPASAADWTWTSNGREITLTGYSGPNAVVIPDMLDGLPVTGFGGTFSGNVDITSVGGGVNIKAVGNSAFEGCSNLSSVTFDQNAPTPTANVFASSTPTIYVSNPHATGWGDTWNGRPVVRAASMADIASHNTDGTAHPDIREAIDAIPLPPTNAVAGWLVWDSGSNCYWQVTAKNLRFYVWGVAE